MTSAAPFDRRVTATRGDLAAANLRGLVEADRFVDGERFCVAVECLDLKRAPRPDAPLETQLLRGETLTLYDEVDGWGWVQAERDHYVGYVAMSGLGAVGPATHRVIVNRTFVYPGPDMKQPIVDAIPMDGRVAVIAMRGAYADIGGYGHVFAAHIAPIDEVASDPVAVAERLIGAPYLWGGKSALGIDCSGLVQLAFSLAGRPMPRDTDMQEETGVIVDTNDALEGLRRGDLVFWRGHVGIMMDSLMLLHANAHHMLVAKEQLSVARDRIANAAGAGITSIRRHGAKPVFSA